MTRLRLAVIADSYDEHWKSMDVCADELVEALAREARFEIDVQLFRWPFPRLARRVRDSSGAYFVDRVSARYVAYPLRLPRGFDAIHLVDHSYGHLALYAPGSRVGVYLHDLDAFAERQIPFRARAAPRRMFAELAWRGVSRCGRIFYSTEQVRAPAVRAGLRADRFVHAALGVGREFRPDGPPHRTDARYVFHVGSDLPRRRIDVLLRAFAVLRQSQPDLVLHQRGAYPTRNYASLLAELGIAHAVVDLEPLTAAELAARYRGAEATVLSSDAEGFGLPLIEALACGSPVACTDIPAFREVGGDVVARAPAGDPVGLAGAIERAMRGRGRAALDERLAHAKRYSWDSHARVIANAYLGWVSA